MLGVRTAFHNDPAPELQSKEEEGTVMVMIIVTVTECCASTAL